jgi:hypothetical protein
MRLEIQTRILYRRCQILIPDVAKAGGLQSQGVKGEIVVGYLDPLTTQDLKSSGFPDVLGRSSKSEAQRVNNMVKSTSSFEFTIGDIQEIVFSL